MLDQNTTSSQIRLLWKAKSRECQGLRARYIAGRDLNPKKSLEDDCNTTRISEVLVRDLVGFYGINTNINVTEGDFTVLEMTHFVNNDILLLSKMEVGRTGEDDLIHGLADGEPLIFIITSAKCQPHVEAIKPVSFVYYTERNQSQTT